jgi:hypothetical protein
MRGEDPGEMRTAHASDPGQDWNAQVPVEVPSDEGGGRNRGAALVVGGFEPSSQDVVV